MDAADTTNPLYYLTPFSYVGMSGGSGDVAHSSHMQGSATSSETPFSHSPPAILRPLVRGLFRFGDRSERARVRPANTTWGWK